MPLKNSSSGFGIFPGTASLTLTSTTLYKAGGAGATVSVTMTEGANGAYRIAPLAAHRDTVGHNLWVFELSDGTPYIPIGVNICWPRFERDEEKVSHGK